MIILRNNTERWTVKSEMGYELNTPFRADSNVEDVKLMVRMVWPLDEIVVANTWAKTDQVDQDAGWIDYGTKKLSARNVLGHSSARHLLHGGQ